MNNVFHADNIVLGATFNDKEEAIIAAGKILEKNGYVTSNYINAMIEREKVITTYIGNNISIPHGVMGSEQYIVNSGISFIQVPNGVPFGKNIAYIIMGIAGKDNTHMDILINISTVVADIKNVEKLKNAKTKQEVLNLFKEI